MPDTLLCIVLALLVIAGVVNKWTYVAWISASALMVFSAAGMVFSTAQVTNFSDLPLEDGYWRIPWSQSVFWLLFVFAWLSVGIVNQRRRLFILMHVAMFVWLLIVLIADLNEQQRWYVSNTHVTSVHTLFYLFVLLMAGFFFRNLIGKSFSIDKKGVGGWLCIFIGCSTTLIWFQNTHRLQDYLESTIKNIHQELQSEVTELTLQQKQVMRRFATRSFSYQPEERELYLAVDGTNYINDLSELDYIGLFDKSENVMFSISRIDKEKTWYDNYLKRELNKGRLFNEGDQALTYDPLVDHTVLYTFLPSKENSDLRIVASVLNYGALMQRVLPELMPSGFTAYLHDNSVKITVFDSIQSTQCHLRKTNTIVLNDVAVWTLHVCTDLSALPFSRIIEPDLILTAGLLAMVLSLFSQLLQQKSRLHWQRLLSANERTKRTLDEQQRLKTNLQQIMENSADVICMVNLDGFFVELSHSAEEVLGYSIAELKSRPFINFVHPDDVEMTKQEAGNILAGSVAKSFRNRYLRKDGSVVYLMWSARYISSMKTLYAVAHDITDLKKIEDYQLSQKDILKLVASDASLEQVLLQIGQVAEQHSSGLFCSISIIEEEHMVRHVSPSLPTGLIAALCNENHFDISLINVIKNMQLAVTSNYSRLIGDEHPFRKTSLISSWSLPIMSKQGELIGSCTFYCKEERQPLNEELELMASCCRFAAIAIERNIQKVMLEESEQRYRSLYQFNPDPVFSFDLNGTFINMNEAGCQLLGSPESAIVGKSFEPLILASELDEVKKRFALVLKGQAQRYEASVHSSEGELKEFLITNLPIVVSSQVVGVFGIAKDVTERNQIAADLRKSVLRISQQSALLMGLNECAVGIHSDWDNQATLNYVAAQIQLLTGCRSVLVSVTDRAFEDTPVRVCVKADFISDEYEMLLLRLSETLEKGLFSGENSKLNLAEFSDDLNLEEQNDYVFYTYLTNRSGQSVGHLVLSDNQSGDGAEYYPVILQQFAKLIFSSLEYRQLLQSVTRSERVVSRQLQFNKAVTNSMTDALFVTDFDLAVRYTNPSAENLIRDLNIGSDVIPTLLPQVASFKQQLEHFDQEIAITKNSKEKMFFRCKVSPLDDEDKNHDGWLITLHDQSSERRMNQVIKEREQFFTLSLELFCLVGLDGNFIQVNPAFSLVLGYNPKELIGFPYMNIIETDDHRIVDDAIVRLNSGELIQDLEFRVRTKNGDICWLQLSASLQDQIIYCAARDVTAKRQSLLTLKSTMEELERSNAELNEFAYVASHDLQEPLRKIRTFSERLVAKSDLLEPQSKEYVVRMSAAAERMQNLITDLLKYSRLNAGELILCEVNVSALLKEILLDLETTISSLDAEIVIDIKHNIFVDQIQIRQLLQNLITNALKFHKQGETPRVTIRTEERSQHQVLIVQDEGIGFDAVYAEKIFNPFQRLHNKTDYAGTGIGLSIVKKIADRHHARIEVETEIGKGSRFSIVFPKQPQEITEMPPFVKNKVTNLEAQ
jgi:PAS domain S-box-containing protein